MSAERFGFAKRRRISSEEIPPSDFCLARDRSMRLRNFGLLLRETVSMSALLAIILCFGNFILNRQELVQSNMF